jgi:hypothetical protein
MPSLPAKGLSELKLPASEQKAIEKGNAETLFPRWKT